MRVQEVHEVDGEKLLNRRNMRVFFMRVLQVHEVEGEKLLESAEPITIPNAGFALEMVPNRDSIPYSDAYGRYLFQGLLIRVHSVHQSL